MIADIRRDTCLPVRRICSVLEVPRSSYYHAATPTSTQLADQRRDCQYGSKAHRALLGRHGIIQSMSARANPYHNAWTESFIGTLKNEMLGDGCFIDGRDASPDQRQKFYHAGGNRPPGSGRGMA